MWPCWRSRCATYSALFDFYQRFCGSSCFCAIVVLQHAQHKSNALNAVAPISDDHPYAAPAFTDASHFNQLHPIDIERSVSASAKHTPRPWSSRPLSSRPDTRHSRPASSWRSRASSLSEVLETHAQTAISEESYALDNALRETALALDRGGLHSHAIADEFVSAAHDPRPDGVANANLSPPHSAAQRRKRTPRGSSSTLRSKILQPAILFSTLAQELDSLHTSPSTARLDFLNRVVGMACRVLGAEHATVYMQTSNEAACRIDAVASTSALAIQLPLGVGLAGACAATARIINVDDAQLDARFCADFDRSSGVQTRSVLCIPIFEHADSPSNATDECMPPVDRLLNRALFRSRKDAVAAVDASAAATKSPVLVGVLQVLNKPSKFTPFDECAADLIASSISHFLATDNLRALLSKRQSNLADILSTPFTSSIPSTFAAAGTVFSQISEIKCSIGALSLQNKHIVHGHPNADATTGALEAFGLPLWSLAAHLSRTLDVEIVNFFFLPRVLDAYLPAPDGLSHLAVYAPHIETAAQLSKSTTAPSAHASLAFLEGDDLIQRSPPFEIIACIMQPEQVIGICKEVGACVLRISSACRTFLIQHGIICVFFRLNRCASISEANCSRRTRTVTVPHCARAASSVRRSVAQWPLRPCPRLRIPCFGTLAAFR
jgi:hypothetical protein